MNNPSLHFYPNACAVCKRFGSQVELKKCRFCKMISYCSDEHQEINWLHHKEICTAIEATHSHWKLHEIKYDLVDNESCYHSVWIKEKFAISVALKLNRRLTPYELEMLDFAAACIVCRTKENLYNCSNCASTSYCNKHKLEFKITHKYETCSHLKQCYFLDLFEFKQPIKLVYANVLTRENYANVTNMGHFLNTFLTKLHLLTERDLLMSVDYTAAHSEYVTRPLTVLFGLNKINDCYKESNINDYEDSELLGRTEMIIHVIASNHTEAATVGGWEVLLHLLKKLKMLKIILIGPELEEVSNDIVSHPLCETCKIYRKTMLVEYHTCVYEDYKENKQYMEPQIVVAFNASLYAYDKELVGYIDTWSNTIGVVNRLRCPFILTSYTSEEAKKDLIKIKSITYDESRLIYNDDNPFASIRPYRCAEKDIAIFKNTNIIIFGFPIKSVFGKVYGKPKLPKVNPIKVKKIDILEDPKDQPPTTSSDVQEEEPPITSTVEEKPTDVTLRSKVTAQESVDSGTAELSPCEEIQDLPGEAPENSDETEAYGESGEIIEVPGTSDETTEAYGESGEATEVPETSGETFEILEENDETIERREGSDLSPSELLHLPTDLYPLSDTETSDISYEQGSEFEVLSESE